MSLECSLRIIPLCLPVYIEFSLWSRIIPNSSHVKPVARIASGVKIDEPMFKPSSSGTPIQSEVMNRVGRNILTSSVGHESCEAQLVHIGVDKGTARRSGDRKSVV